MIKLEKDGVIMVVSEDMANHFKKEGYREKAADVKPVAPVLPVVEMEETESRDDVKENENQKLYQRSEITRMSTADLKEVAKSLGLEVTEESTGKILKEQIIEKLGL